MHLVIPEFGTIVWMLLAFSIVLFILRKFAWKPILNALHERENSISDALKSAEKAKEEMAQLQANNEKIINEAKEERDKLLKEAKNLKEQIISEAKSQANVEADKIVLAAKENIEKEKTAAIAEIRKQIAELSLVIAEKLIREKLKDEKAQQDIVNKYIDEIKLN